MAGPGRSRAILRARQFYDDGAQRQFWRLPTQADQLVAHVGAIAAPDKRLALEESNLTRWLWQLLRP